MAKSAVTRYVASIDIGSSRVRCLVFDLRGRLKGAASADLPVRTPRGPGFLAKELAPRSFWGLVCRLMHEALALAAVTGRDIAGVAVTSQREGVAVIGGAGSEVYLAPNTDLRAFMEGQAIDSKYRDLVYTTTGHTPSFLLAPAKLHWLRNNLPDVYGRSRWVLSLDAWLARRLGADPYLERSAAVELGLADVTSGKTAADLLAMLGIRQDMVPTIVSAGQCIGRVSAQAARLCGLPAGTPMIAGGPDTQCALLGMGVTAHGGTGIVAGWSAPVQMVLDHPCLDPVMRTWSGRHVAAGWVLESTTADAGRAYRWVWETLFLRADETRLVRMAGGVPPGANGALAFLGPRIANMGTVSAAIGGLLFPLLSSVQAATPADLLRAALENVAYAIKGNVAQLELISGQQGRRVSFAGGMSRNKTLTNVLADVLGREVLIPRAAEVSGLGAAMCAAVGAGVYASFEEAVHMMASPMRPVMPNPVRALEYQEHYQRWQAAGARLESLNAEL